MSTAASTKKITCTFIVPAEKVELLERLLRQFEPVRDEDMTLAQACREFKLAPATINRWVNKLKLVPFSQPVPGGNKYVRRSDIVALLAAKEEEKKQPRRRKTVLDMRRTRP